jgi:hypothetical protein
VLWVAFSGIIITHEITRVITLEYADTVVAAAGKIRGGSHSLNASKLTQKPLFIDVQYFHSSYGHCVSL